MQESFIEQFGEMYKLQLREVEILISSSIASLETLNFLEIEDIGKKVHKLAGTAGYFESEVFQSATKSLDRYIHENRSKSIDALKDGLETKLKEFKGHIQTSKYR